LILYFVFFALFESFRGLRKFSGGPWVSKNGDLLAPRRQERQVRKFTFCGLCAFARDIPISFFVFFAPFAVNSPVPNRIWLRLRRADS
jgi:hypothetical protein